MKNTKVNYGNLLRELASLARNKVRIPWAEFADSLNVHPEALRSRVRRYRGPLETNLTLDIVRARRFGKETTNDEASTENPIRAIAFSAHVPVVGSFDDAQSTGHTWGMSFFLKPDMSNLVTYILTKISPFRMPLQSEESPDAFIEALRTSIKTAVDGTEVVGTTTEHTFMYKSFAMKYTVRVMRHATNYRRKIA